MMLDIPFARKVLDFAKAEHADFMHEQSTFYQAGLTPFCGTMACLAGVAGMLHPDAQIKPVRNSCGQVAGWDPYYKNELTDWEKLGATTLGLTSGQADDLFYTMDESLAIEMLESYIADAETEQI